jgi:hypothetical protein
MVILSSAGSIKVYRGCYVLCYILLAALLYRADTALKHGTPPRATNHRDTHTLTSDDATCRPMLSSLHAQLPSCVAEVAFEYDQIPGLGGIKL